MRRNEFVLEVTKYFLQNKGKIIGGIIGFIFGILFLMIGFFKTLVIILCTAIGFIIGSRWDLEGDFVNFLNKILPPQFK